MPTCDDCGAPFQGPAKDHYTARHPGMLRYRYSGPNGATMECAKCGATKTSSSSNHGKLSDWIGRGHVHDTDSDPDTNEEE